MICRKFLGRSRLKLIRIINIVVVKQLWEKGRSMSIPNIFFTSSPMFKEPEFKYCFGIIFTIFFK